MCVVAASFEYFVQDALKLRKAMFTNPNAEKVAHYSLWACDTHTHTL